MTDYQRKYRLDNTLLTTRVVFIELIETNICEMEWNNRFDKQEGPLRLDTSGIETIPIIIDSRDVFNVSVMWFSWIIMMSLLLVD